ncbi:tRNA-specific 2-thiouridylase [Plasmodium inui San Antonio 1]|uniref:tRNA-specific 2-thiouridylase n=1 Tax=Plasmodium inui San Antonio 1 TaxID=1237626 RepID=W7A688_9APIC|nr:tRNA-specific 2-thiouridylase [Plasmodium inui San Antonio 1]EUD64599.1 tRNA-specific 2-thiouridylase [Plasmodium inui San Antonio 1]
MNRKDAHRWRIPECYIVKGGLRRRLSKGGPSPSVNKLNRCAVTPLSGEACGNDYTKPNKHYEAHIRNVCEELQQMNDREDKMRHLMRENTNVCTVNLSEPVDRRSFTLRHKSKSGSAGRDYFINEVSEGVLYRYVERCNSNLYLAVDVVDAGGEEGCEVDLICPPSEQSLRRSDHSCDTSHWQSILRRKKFTITVDGFSDNIVLFSFLRVLLKGLKRLDLQCFLNMGFEGVVNQLSHLYTIHVNWEQIAGHVMSQVERFLGRLCREVENQGVSKRLLGRPPVQRNMHMYRYPRVAHMLSGGVDSLMALRLLERKKFHVHNFFLNFAHQDCSKSDLKYVKKICAKRKNLFIVNINEEYTEEVLIPMLRSYSEGNIPNADILCNEKVKYNLLIRTMRKLCRERGDGWDYSYVSTGHYAMISTNDERNANRLFSRDFPYVGDDTDGEVKGRTPRKRYRLIVGRDEKKDQTFFLSSFSEKQLSRFLFPLCLHRKSDVKRIMEGRAAGKYNRKETRGLCLYGRVDMNSLLGLYLGGGSMTRVGSEGESEGGSIERERGPVEREKGPLERGRNPTEKERSSAEESLPIKAASGAARALQWDTNQLRSPEFRAFQEKHLPSFDLRFKNYIINVEDGTVLDTNEGIHLYAIGQKKHITNHLHQVYNAKGRGRSCQKNFISSCQWTVVYKKMLRCGNGDVKESFKENFIYVSRDYGSALFRHLRGRCKLGAFRWVASVSPSYLRGGASKKDAAERDEADRTLIMPATSRKLAGQFICVRVRNSEQIKEAKIALDDLGETAYLTLKQKDIGLSPGQIITLYLPFIVKGNGKAKYVYSLRRGKKDSRIFFHCLGSARIINQYLNRGLYRRLMEIHRRNNLPLWGRDKHCGLVNSEAALQS